MNHDTDRETADGSLVDQTREEHRSCMQLVAEIETCLDRRPDDPVIWLGDLTSALARLRDELAEHFDDEQSGQMFRGLPISHPRLASPLAKLEAEHPVMLANLDDLLQRARAIEQPEVYRLRELNGLTQLFAARIRRHEAAEYELVMDAYWSDVGTGD